MDVFMAMAMKGMYFAVGSAALIFGTDVFLKGNKSATSMLGSDLEHLKGTDGFMLSKKHQMNFKNSCQGVAVIGPPGEGKTVSFGVPHVLTDTFPKNTSIVSHDGKGQLFELTAKYQHSIGRRVILFAPLEGIGFYNPLEFCKNFTEVRSLANNLLVNGTLAARLSSSGSGTSGNDATWITMANPLLTMALLFVKDVGEPYNTITGALRFLISTDAKELIDIFSTHPNREIREQYKVFQMADGADAAIGSIKITLATNLTLFLDPKIEKATSKSDFSPELLKKEKVALYVKYNPLDAEYLSPLTSIFYSQLIEKTMVKEGNGIVWLLDEFNNLGKIQSFSLATNTCKECNHAYMIFIQSMCKLYDIYGKNDATAILNSMKTKCILPSISELETMKYVSDLCGYVEVNEMENGRSRKIKKKLFEPDEVRRIKSERVVIVPHNILPIMDKQNIFYKNKKMVINQNIGGIHA